MVSQQKQTDAQTNTDQQNQTKTNAHTNTNAYKHQQKPNTNKTEHKQTPAKKTLNNVHSPISQSGENGSSSAPRHSSLLTRQHTNYALATNQKLVLAQAEGSIFLAFQADIGSERTNIPNPIACTWHTALAASIT